jgi:hypothetical protein
MPVQSEAARTQHGHCTEVCDRPCVQRCGPVSNMPCYHRQDASEGALLMALLMGLRCVGTGCCDDRGSRAKGAVQCSDGSYSKPTHCARCTGLCKACVVVQCCLWPFVILKRGLIALVTVIQSSWPALGVSEMAESRYGDLMLW